jgi:hypothetical protein
LINIKLTKYQTLYIEGKNIINIPIFLNINVIQIKLFYLNMHEKVIIISFCKSLNIIQNKTFTIILLKFAYVWMCYYNQRKSILNPDLSNTERDQIS